MALEPLPKTFYRPDIDGLRALAVLPVLLFHADLIFRGGFVGVDVFFVISGYLITQIIERDVKAGRFSVLAFYQRRVRRIFPALFAMFAVMKGRRLEYVFKGVLSTPIRYALLASEMVTISRFATDLWITGNRKWRK